MRKMLSFELGKEISERCFFVLLRAWDKENVEFPRGIEPQTWFRAPMLYHWATETPWWAKPITKFM